MEQVDAFSTGQFAVCQVPPLLKLEAPKFVHVITNKDAAIYTIYSALESSLCQIIGQQLFLGEICHRHLC